MKSTTSRILLALAALTLALLLAVCLPACSDSLDTSVPTTDAGTVAPDEPESSTPAPVIPDEPETTVPTPETDAPETEESLIIPDGGEWSENIAYAKSLENGVYNEYLNNDRTIWFFRNRNMTFTYDRDTLHAFSNITNIEGIPYVENTGFGYIIDSKGEVLTSANTRDVTMDYMTNTYELGYYYYQSHVFGENFSRSKDLGFIEQDRTFHVYSDKFNLEQHLITTKEVKGISGYGQYFDVEIDRVLSLVVKDANGTHDTLEGVDWASAEYIGFDVGDAGIFGIILAPDLKNDSGVLTVTEVDGYYRVDQRITFASAMDLPEATHYYFGCRIYTDAAHDFDEFLVTAEGERNPIPTTNIVTTDNDDASYVVGYDALRGAYVIFVDGQAMEQIWNQYFSTSIKLFNTDLDRKIYVMTNNGIGVVENAVFIDGDGQVLPIQPEVCKNFGGDFVDPVHTPPGDPGYSNVYFPLVLKAGETREFTVLNLHQSWGSFALKQLSSVAFFAPYYHFSIGVCETNCISPDGVTGKDYWFLPDFRPLSGTAWNNDFQCDAIGTHHLLRYTDANGEQSLIENSQAIIDSSGPIYADITNYYSTLDGRADISYRHVELPQTDENRTYYSINMSVNEEIVFNDFRNTFELYGFSGRFFHFENTEYLNTDNEITQVKHDSFSHEDSYVLGKEYPFYAVWGIDWDNTDGNDFSTFPNFAIIIKDWDIVIGGKKFDGNFIVNEFSTDGDRVTRASLSLDLGDVTLQPGDHINVNLILFPWGGDKSVDISNVLNVREDSMIDPYKITPTVGSVIEDTYVPKVMSDNGTAEFTITGGDNIAAVRVYGLSKYQRPTIQEKVNGEWVDYDTTGSDYTKYVFENDGYMVYYDGDGTYSVAFAVDMTGVGDEGRTFRVIEAE